MTCDDPIDLETLAAWWLGELPKQREATLDEHLFGCASCTRRLEGLAALASGVRAAVRDGRVNMVVSSPFVDAMKRAGMHVREYRVDPGGSVACTIHAEDDAVVSRLRAPLTGVARVDIVRMRAGEPDLRHNDVPFDAETGEVLVIPSASWLKTMPAFAMRMRLVAVGEAGERPIGDYTFNHSPS